MKKQLQQRIAELTARIEMYEETLASYPEKPMLLWQRTAKKMFQRLITENRFERDCLQRRLDKYPKDDQS